MDRLSEIRERADKATTGPWRWDEGRLSAGEHEQVLWPANALSYADANGDWSAILGASGEQSERQAEANAEFVAAARSDVPYLLAEVERLRRVERAARGLLNVSDTLAVDLILTQRLSDEATGRWHVRRADLRAALAEKAPQPHPQTP